MSDLAPTLQAFFTDRLMRQRQASGHTIAAYRDTFRLLLPFTCTRTGKQPSTLNFADLDAPLIGSFLDHLETGRGNSVRTRNARLAAIHSLFRFAVLRHPEHAALIQRVLAIPAKRFDKALVSYLTPTEIDTLLAAVDRTTWTGRRDHTLLLTTIQTGLRVSELTALTNRDISLGTGAHLHCHGKGRKDRCTPLTTTTVATLRIWLKERAGQPDDPLFPTRTGRPLGRDAVRRLVARHATHAGLNRISPHALRHTAAMQLLHAGVDTTIIALWLGHEQTETTQIYLHADLGIKERALARTSPPNIKPGRYHTPDTLLTFLENL